jgi:hypothetical protein
LLGNTLMGFFGDLVGLHQALALGGVMSLIGILLALFFLPAFLNYRSEDSSEKSALYIKKMGS